MRIVIDGAGQVGSHLAKMLVSTGAEVCVIDEDSRLLEDLSSLVDLHTVCGELSSISTLKQAGAQHADLFIAIGPADAQEVNLVSAILAKNLGARKVVAMVGQDEMVGPEASSYFEAAGVDMTFCPSRIVADEIVDLLKHANTAESMDFAGGKLTISAFRLSEYSPLLDLKLIDFVGTLTKEESEEFRIIAISRNASTIIPKFDTKFRFGDTIYTITTPEGQSRLEQRIGAVDVDVDSVMILGGGMAGEKFAELIDREVSHVKLIEADRERCMELTINLPDSVMVVNGDGRNSDFLLEESLPNYDAFVALSGRDEVNVLACVAAKKFGVKRTVAEVDNIEYMRLAEDMGVDMVINRKLLTAGKVFKLILGDKARSVRYMSGTDAEVLEYSAHAGAAITKAPLKDLKFPPDAVVGGVIRKDQALIAVGDTLIEDGDQVCVFARPSSVKAVDKLFR